jgi:hypothetical protein
MRKHHGKDYQNTAQIAQHSWQCILAQPLPTQGCVYTKPLPCAVAIWNDRNIRHYFETRVLQSSGNRKLAQRLARHTSIAATQRYARLSDNELNQGYWEAIEDRKK